MYKKAKTIRIEKYVGNADTFYFKHSGKFEYIQRLLAKASRRADIDVDHTTQFLTLIGYQASESKTAVIADLSVIFIIKLKTNSKA